MAAFLRFDCSSLRHAIGVWANGLDIQSAGRSGKALNPIRKTALWKDFQRTRPGFRPDCHLCGANGILPSFVGNSLERCTGRSASSGRLSKAAMLPRQAGNIPQFDMIFLQFCMSSCIFPETRVNFSRGSELGAWELTGLGRFTVPSEINCHGYGPSYKIASSAIHFILCK